MKLEEKIVLLRKEKGLTQLQAAEKLNVSRQAISKWESGSAVPSIDNLKYLGELYGVPVDYLLNDDMECISRQEDVAEKPIEHQRGRKRSRWLILVACIIAVAVAGVLIYGKALTGQPHNFDFEEMERDSWETTETGDFSIKW